MSIKLIDQTNAIDAIKRKYGGRYFEHPDARLEACALWGVTSNEHGVAVDAKEETLVQVGGCKAEMRYIKGTSGHVLLGLCGSTAIGGFGYAPSIWDRKGFADYWDARHHAIEKLITYFEEEAITTNSCSSAANKTNALKASQILRGEMTPQLNLF